MRNVSDHLPVAMDMWVDATWFAKGSAVVGDVFHRYVDGDV